MILRALILPILLFSQIAFAEQGVYIIDREEAIKHVLNYEDYEAIETVEDEKLKRRIKRETQILSEKLEKFKFEAPNLPPSVKKTRKAELVKYGQALQALEKKLIGEKEKFLEKHYVKVQKQWKKQSKAFYRMKKAKVVFLKSDGKTVYRGKGVTPLTIKVLKSQKNKTDLTDEFIAHADKLAGRKPEPEEEYEEDEEEETEEESQAAPKS